MRISVHGDPEQVEAALAGALSEVQVTKTSVGVLGMGFVALLVGLLWAVDPEIGFGLGIGATVVAILIGGSVLKNAWRREEKIRFAKRLHELLGDDYAPGRKVRMSLDPSGYNSAGKQVWSGRSQHGNPKFKYEDRWLDLTFWLVDGTRVKVIRRGAVKTRKGNIVRDKRRLFVRLARQAPFDAGVVADQARAGVFDCFHDPPEGLTLNASTDKDRHNLRIRVTQLDAPILADEVIAVLRTVLVPPTLVPPTSPQATKVRAAQARGVKRQTEGQFPDPMRPPEPVDPVRNR